MILIWRARRYAGAVAGGRDESYGAAIVGLVFVTPPPAESGLGTRDGVTTTPGHTPRSGPIRNAAHSRSGPMTSAASGTERAGPIGPGTQTRSG